MQPTVNKQQGVTYSAQPSSQHLKQVIHLFPFIYFHFNVNQYSTSHVEITTVSVLLRKSVRQKLCGTVLTAKSR